MDLSDLLSEDKPSVAEEGDEEKGVKKHEPVEVPDPSIHPKSVRKHKKNIGLELWNKVQEVEEVEDDVLETEPKQVVGVVDDAQDAQGEKTQYKLFQDEPELNIKIEEEPETWHYKFEARVLGAKTKEEYLSLLLEKHEKLSEEYRDRNFDLEEGELNSNLRQFRNLRSSKVQDIEVEFDLLNKARGARKQVLSREGPFAVSQEESEEQNTRDARRRLGAYITGSSSYEERINRTLEEVDQKILSAKRKIYDTLIKYPGKSSFSTPITSTKKAKEHAPDPAKSGVVTSLNKVLERAIKASGEMFVDDPDGLEQYIAELENDHRNYGFKITKLVVGALGAKQAYDDEVINAPSEEEIPTDNYNKWLDLSRQANELLSEFGNKYDPKKHELRKVLDKDVREELGEAAFGQQWVKNAAIVIVFSAVYERTTKIYGERGIRYVHMEVGHAAQNVYLQAVSLELGTVVVGAFDDEKVKEILKIKEDPLYLMPVGKIKTTKPFALLQNS